VKSGFFFIFKLKFCFPNARACMHTYAVYRIHSTARRNTPLYIHVGRCICLFF